MKIRIKGDGHNLLICLPTRLVFSKATVYLANTVGRKYAADAMKDISPEALDRLFAEFRRMKRENTKWELVDIESANGEIVRVTL